MEDQYPISLATEYRHKHPIRVIFTEPGGAHSIFQDEKGTVFLFSPVEDSVNEIKSFKGIINFF